MAPPDPFEDDPDTTREAIMGATYRALRAHGYADLTIQRIGDEFEKSKSLLYHHYDGKDDLLLDFLEFMLERFEADVPHDEPEDAADHLLAILEHVFPGEAADERAAFVTAIVELRGQAAHEPAYRDQITRSDRVLHDLLASIVRRGIEQGAFRDVDPDRVAAFLNTVVAGAMFRWATTDDDASLRAARRELSTYVDTRLLVPGTDAGSGTGGDVEATRGSR